MDDPKRPSLLALVISTLAAAFGVQSKSKLEQDFKSSSIVPYVIAGLVFTGCFIAIVAVVVQLVIANS
jgi:hypothetical protein